MEEGEKGERPVSDEWDDEEEEGEEGYDPQGETGEDNNNIPIPKQPEEVTLADALANVEAIMSLTLEPLDSPFIEAPAIALQYERDLDTQFKDRGGFNTGIGKFADEASTQAELVSGRMYGTTVLLAVFEDLRGKEVPQLANLTYAHTLVIESMHEYKVHGPLVPTLHVP